MLKARPHLGRQTPCLWAFGVSSLSFIPPAACATPLMARAAAVRIDPAAAAEQVRLRRHAASKDFKGSCFVEMGDAATMTALVAKSAAGEIVHDGAPLKLEPKVSTSCLFSGIPCERLSFPAANKAGDSC